MNETGERPHVTEAQRARANELRAKAENARWWAQDEADADQKAQYLKLAAALEREAAAPLNNTDRGEGITASSRAHEFLLTFRRRGAVLSEKSIESKTLGCAQRRSSIPATPAQNDDESQSAQTDDKERHQP